MTNEQIARPCGKTIGNGETCSSGWYCSDCQEKLDTMSGFTRNNPDNPYAFPFPTNHPAHGGMTLRDWFAGQALMGLIARSEPGQLPLEEDLANHADKIAATMLAKRSTKGD